MRINEPHSFPASSKQLNPSSKVCPQTAVVLFGERCPAFTLPGQGGVRGQFLRTLRSPKTQSELKTHIHTKKTTALVHSIS